MERIFILYKGKVKLDSRWREIKYIREIGRGGNTIILSVEEEERKVWFEGILNFDEGLKMFAQQFRVEDNLWGKIFHKEWLNFLTDSYLYQTRDIRLITVDDKAKWKKKMVAFFNWTNVTEQPVSLD